MFWIAIARMTKRLRPARSEAKAVPIAKPSGRLWTKRTRKTRAEVRTPGPLRPMNVVPESKRRATRARKPTPTAAPASTSRADPSSNAGTNRPSTAATVITPAARPISNGSTPRALEPRRNTGTAPTPVASAVPQAARKRTSSSDIAPRLGASGAGRARLKKPLFPEIPFLGRIARLSPRDSIEHPESPREIFIRFLKFGCLAWGGPAAQIAMIKRECVDEEMWISEPTFKRQLAVYQVLPGPEAHELCVYFGRLRGGKLGGFMAGLGFMLPGFLLMLALSALYVETSLAGDLHSLFYGLSAAVGALVARAVVRLGKSFLTDLPLVLIAIAGFALTLFAGASFVLVLLGGGIAYELWRNARAWIGRAGSFTAGPLAIVLIALGAISFSL